MAARRGSAALGMAATALAVAALAVAALTIGRFPLGLADLWSALGAWLDGAGAPAGPAETVLLQVRAPRVAAAVLVGAAIAAAGACYQGLFRNPLVSPDILGVSSGAGLGAVLGIFLSLPVVAIQLVAFAAGLATVAAVYLIATAVRGHEPVLVLVLAGVVIGTLTGAAISLLKILADPYDQLPAITFWLLGSLAQITPGDLAATLPAVLIGLVPLWLLRWRINVLTLGDEEARALGVEVGRLRIALIAAATLMTAAVVSISGIVGWVGLVMPHCARLVVGPDFRRLLPAAMLMGGGFLLFVDTLARTLARIEVPLGILTAVLGAPVFLWLLASRRRGWQ